MTKQEKTNFKWRAAFLISLTLFALLNVIGVITAISHYITGEAGKPGGSAIRMGISVIICIIIVALRNEELHYQLRNKDDIKFSPRFEEILKKANEDVALVKKAEGNLIYDDSKYETLGEYEHKRLLDPL